MTTAKILNLLLPLNIKKEKDERISDDNNSDNCDVGDEDSDRLSFLLQPNILDNDCFSKADPKDEFLQLTSLVRRVYFSYLHKSIINNYNVCCTTIKDRKLSRGELKKCASLLELNAVRACLATSLYRQEMLKIISDIKSNTSEHKVHKKLALFLDTPPKTVDAAVQTSFDVNSTVDETCLILKDNPQSLYNTEIQQLNGDIKINNFRETFDMHDEDIVEMKLNINTDEKWDKKDKVELPVTDTCNDEINIKDDIDNNKENISNFDNNIDTSVQDIFGDDSAIGDHNLVHNDDHESRDSLIQHLENMFGESDDSSDLMSLIEKHSGVTKSNVDREISKMCSEISPINSKSNNNNSNNKTNINNSNNSSNSTLSRQASSKLDSTNITTSDQQSSHGKRKLSFTNYKTIKKRAIDSEAGTSQHEEIKEDGISKKQKGIWFVERVHQVSKLKNKMMELSIKNYRKHGRVRALFVVLFGDVDENEEMMPDSPIYIEEHLTACKERIAPWVVKYLMPYYSKKIIMDRPLFKAVAKHITDMLIIATTFPEEECVNQYIKNYFRNKSIIKTEADIYV